MSGNTGLKAVVVSRGDKPGRSAGRGVKYSIYLVGEGRGNIGIRRLSKEDNAAEKYH